jgi:ABC-type branched-subunit amino acid transport system ATPase component
VASLVVEQNAEVALSVADRAVVLDRGGFDAKSVGPAHLTNWIRCAARSPLLSRRKSMTRSA